MSEQFEKDLRKWAGAAAAVFFPFLFGIWIAALSIAIQLNKISDRLYDQGTRVEHATQRVARELDEIRTELYCLRRDTGGICR